ncbi:MAG: SurA N-terminal domain-containing protein [Alphaproteobacteria bacterium]|nr:SurA N-terminal domain-containing protein [Alphaproteobacteria bacterium]
MLQSMRHLAQSWLFKGLMLILVVSFAIWGVGDIFRGNPQNRTVVKVGKMAITAQAVEQAFREALAQARQMVGFELSEQQAMQTGLLDKVVDGMIDRSVIDQDIERLGIDVNEKLVANHIAALPQFQKDGKFDKELFRQRLTQIRMTERDLLAQGRQEMARQQLLNSITNIGKVPQSIIDAVYEARGQKRVFDVVILKNASVKTPEPEDKVLQDYYQQNLQRFTSPEYRGLTIVRLATDDVQKDITLSEEDVKKAYEARIAQFTRPERRDILQVILQDEARARQLAAAVQSGKDLIHAAKMTGHTVVPLNGTEEKTLLPELAKPVFEIKAGQVSDAIKSPLGWHIFQVTKIIPGSKRDYNEVKTQLRDTLRRDQAVDTAMRMVNQLDDELAAGHALEDIADSLKLRLVKIPPVDAKGRTADGKEPSEMPEKDNVLKAGFDQNAGETSPVMDDKKGNYFVVRTDEVTPSAQRPFEKVRDSIVASWKVREQAKLAATEAEKIAQGLREGKKPSSFAAGSGVEVRVSKPVSLLNDADPDVSPAAAPQMFKMKKGEVSVSSLMDRQMIVRLAEIIEVDENANAGIKGQVTDALGRHVPQELAEQYVKHLRDIFPVKVNREALNDMRQRGG